TASRRATSSPRCVLRHAFTCTQAAPDCGASLIACQQLDDAFGRRGDRGPPHLLFREPCDSAFPRAWLELTNAQTLRFDREAEMGEAVLHRRQMLDRIDHRTEAQLARGLDVLADCRFRETPQAAPDTGCRPLFEQQRA